MFVLGSLSNYEPSPRMERSQSQQDQGDHRGPQGELNQFNFEAGMY